MLIFGMQVDDDLLYRDIENQSSPAYSFPVFVQFSFLPYFQEWHFSSKISQEPFKLECSYLVCMLMMTCYIVGLRTSCLLLKLSIFVQFSFLLYFVE